MPETTVYEDSKICGIEVKVGLSRQICSLICPTFYPSPYQGHAQSKLGGSIAGSPHGPHCS